MKLSIAAVALSMASAAFGRAMPQIEERADHCVCRSEALDIVARYAALQNLTTSDLGDPTTTANQILADDFQETSDSLNELIGLPVSLCLSCRVILAD